jgi:prepilin-type N-terminal cleavage/methylation domain-containing protein
MAVGVITRLVFEMLGKNMLNYPLRKGRAGFTLVELLTVVVIIGILGAIAIPKYMNYRRSALDAVAKSACDSVIKAQYLLLTEKGNYSADYSELVTLGGLVIDQDIYYGPINLGTPIDLPKFSFTLNHKATKSTTFTFDSGSQNMIAKGGDRVLFNDPTVPN